MILLIMWQSSSRIIVLDEHGSVPDDCIVQFMVSCAACIRVFFQSLGAVSCGSF